MKIPFLAFDRMHKPLKSELMAAFEDVFDRQSYVLGEKLQQFEQSYSLFNQVKFTVGVSNGLDALYLSLKALGIGKGDEVIMPSNTYIATVIAVSNVGAIPVFAEPCWDTYNINPDNIEARITSRTKCIIPVHLYGQACEMDRIMALAKKYDLFVIEDNAQAHGSSFDQKMTGSFGNINATSFYPSKNLGAFGDGGAVTTNSDDLASNVRMLRNYGSSKKYINDVIGNNMRLDECQAAWLLVKLRHLNEWNAERQAIANVYQEALSGICSIKLPVVHERATHVYHLFVIQSEERSELQKYLHDQNIGTLIHYPIPPHLQKAYSFLGYSSGDFPIAEKLSSTCLSLPLWPGMNMKDIESVTRAISSFYV